MPNKLKSISKLDGSLLDEDIYRSRQISGDKSEGSSVG